MDKEIKVLARELQKDYELTDYESLRLAIEYSKTEEMMGFIEDIESTLSKGMVYEKETMISMLEQIANNIKHS